MTFPAGRNTEARLIVRAGGDRFAIPAASVREIVPLPRLTHVPLAPPALLGLSAVRGETVAVLALGLLAGAVAADEADEGPTRRLLMLDGPVRAAIAVDVIERLDRDWQDRTPTEQDPVEIAIDELVTAAMPMRDSSRRAGAAVRDRKAAARDDRAVYLQFSVGSQSFALPLGSIVEVVLVPEEVALLPMADPGVVGSAPWRGRVIGILSLAILLGLPPGTDNDDKAQRVLVIELGHHRFGILVERVDTIVRVAPEQIDPVPVSLLRGHAEARISAIYRSAESSRLVSILSADQLLDEARTRGALVKRSAPSDAGSGAARSANASRSVLPVSIGPENLAFPLSSIREVTVRPARISKVPGAPDWLVGIASVGSTPLAIVDQVSRLAGRPAMGRRQRLLVMEDSGLRVGFLVSAVGRVIHCDEGAIEPAPLPESLAGGIFGKVLRLPSDEKSGTERAPLLVVEPSELISSAERDLIQRFGATKAPGKP